MGLGDAHAGPGVGGLDEDGVIQTALHPLEQRLPLTFRLGADGVAPVAVGDAVGIHQRVGHRLVHADRTAQQPAAHTGDVRQRQQALHGAVLAVFAVQHRHRRIDGQQVGFVPLPQQQTVVLPVGADDAGQVAGMLFPAAVRHLFRRTRKAQPPPRFCDANEGHIIFCCIQRPHPGGRRHAADLVFTGNTAEQQRHAQFFRQTAALLMINKVYPVIIPYSAAIGYIFQQKYFILPCRWSL